MQIYKFIFNLKKNLFKNYPQNLIDVVLLEGAYKNLEFNFTESFFVH
jgi:hypothetical protein